MKFYFSTCIFCLIFSSIFSQTRLSLEEAISKSLSQNYSIRIEKKRIEQAQLNNNWGDAGRYPTLTALIQQNNLISDIDNPASFLSGAIINNNVQPSININWIIFDGFRANIEKHRLEQLEAETNGNAQIIIQNTIQGVILAYYRGVLEQERIEVLQKVLNYSRDRKEYADIQVELGTATTAETLLTKTNFLTDSINLINQQLVFRNAVRDLNVLMGEEDIDKMYSLEDTLQAPSSSYVLKDLEDRMLENNPDLKRLFISQTILNDLTSLNRASLYPRLSVDAGSSIDFTRQDLSQATFAGDQRAPQEPINAQTTRYFLNFNLSFTLFNGGNLKRAVQRTMISEEIGNLTIEDRQLSLSRDLVQANDLYEVRKQLLVLATESKKVAQQNLEILEERYNSGLINSFDYRLIQNTFLNAAFNELQATYNLIDANTTLMRLTGGLTQ